LDAFSFHALPFLQLKRTLFLHQLSCFQLQDEERRRGKQFQAYHRLWSLPKGSVVTSISAFSASSFFSKGMVIKGHPWGLKTYSIGDKASAKRFKNLQNTEKNDDQE